MTTRVALSVTITNAYISQGQIVGPTQVVAIANDVGTLGTLGPAATVDMATLSADIAAALAIATTVEAEATSLATYGTTAYTAASTAVLQVGSLQTTVNAGSTDLAALLTLANTTTTDVATTGADINTMATQATYGLTTLLNNQSYNSATRQLSGAISTNVTLTPTQQGSLVANFNAIGAASVAEILAAGSVVTSTNTAISNSGTAVIQAATAVLDVDTVANFISGTIQPAANTISANGTVLLTDVTACSTQGTVVTNDLTALGSTGINSNMYLVYDPTYVQNGSILVQEMNAILTFLQTAGSITL